MSNDSKNRGVVTGTSRSGNLQEALDDAVRQLGPGVPWRLASIDGLQGGIVGDVVNVQIYAVTQAGSGDGGKDGGSGEAEVPTTATGRVEDISGQISYCMDGATYELVSQTPEGEQRLRLKATNHEAERVLKDAAGTRQEVRVTGYLRHVECTRMDVYEAVPVGAPAPTS
jgi:hypothetical protein